MNTLLLFQLNTGLYICAFASFSNFIYDPSCNCFEINLNQKEQKFQHENVTGRSDFPTSLFTGHTDNLVASVFGPVANFADCK